MKRMLAYAVGPLRRSRLSTILLFWALASGNWACEDACVALSKKICRCEATEAQQRACIQRVDSEASQQPSPTTEELEACQQFLDSCTCDKLEAGQFTACGLARQ